MIQSPELTDAYVLCQDCGHAEAYSDAKHFGDESCPKCGGDYCGCNACSGIARLNVQFQAQAKRPAPSDLANATHAEPVKGRAPGSSECASSFRRTEARAKRTLERTPDKQA